MMQFLETDIPPRVKYDHVARGGHGLRRRIAWVDDGYMRVMSGFELKRASVGVNAGLFHKLHITASVIICTKDDYHRAMTHGENVVREVRPPKYEEITALLDLYAVPMQIQTDQTNNVMHLWEI